MTDLLKKNFALLLAVFFCLSLVACGGNAPETLENIVLDDSIDYNFEDTYDEYLGGWYEVNGSLWVIENNGTYFYELYDAYNEVISSGQLQYVKEYRCMYVYSEQEGIAHKCRIGKGDTLYIDSFGTFSRESGGDIEVIGKDWRTWGIVLDSGTITRDGEDTVVLVCVHSSDATFYYDTEDQVLFDFVDYPITLEGDAWEMFQGIDFADLNGDGNSDVTMRFNDGGKELMMVWIWDPEEGYVFREDLSMLTTNGGGISDYVGLWEYVDEDVWIRIYEDETWECLNDEGIAFQFGTVSVDSTGITFYSDDFEETPHFDRTASGDLIDSENDGMLVPAYDIQPAGDSNAGLRGDVPGPGEDDYSVYQGIWLSDMN